MNWFLVLLLAFQSVSGIIPLEGNATDASGIKYVQWAIEPEPGTAQRTPDGGYISFIGPQLTVPPYRLELDTRGLTNGQHTLFMHAVDNAGNRVMVTKVIMVQNTGLRFFPLTPCRIVDTRQSSGLLAPFGPPSLVQAGVRSYPIQASTRCLVPSTAQAYLFNVTVVPPTLGQFLDFITIWPTGQPRPFASTINNYLGTVQNNAAIIPGGTNGAIDVYSSQSTDLILDINGYFAPAP